MNLVKISYHNNNSGRPQLFVKQRVEFFLHYWSFLMSKIGLKFEEKEFSSHRTFLYLIKNQIEGNFQKSRNYIEILFLKNECFSDDNHFIKYIKTKKELEAIRKLKEMLSGNYVKNQYKEEILLHLNKLIIWCDKKYMDIIRKLSYSILKVNKHPSCEEIEQIKFLVNAIIIELYNKGYSENDITRYPRIFIDKMNIPLEKTKRHFDSDEEYSLYRNEEIKNFTLRQQLESLKHVCNRKTHTWYKIYRVFGVELDSDQPIDILEAQFYNPTKISMVKTDIRAINERFEFSDKKKRMASKSYCNLIIKIDSISEDDLELGFNEALNALRIFNRYYYSEGTIRKDVFIIADEHLTSLRGGLFVDERGVYPKPSNNIFFKEALDNLNLFGNKRKDSYSQKIVEFKGFISDFKINGSVFDLPTIWSYLESLFENIHEIKKVSYVCLINKSIKDILLNAILNIKSMFSYGRSYDSYSIHDLNNEQKKSIGINEYGGIIHRKNSSFHRKLKILNSFPQNILFVKFYTNRFIDFELMKSTINSHSDGLVDFLYMERVVATLLPARRVKT